MNAVVHPMSPAPEALNRVSPVLQLTRYAAACWKERPFLPWLRCRPERAFLPGASAALSREGRVTGHRCLHIVAEEPVEGTHETEMRLLNIKPPPLAPVY